MKSRYFSHDVDARNDPKVTKLRAKFGMEGYGCYFALLEMFASMSDHTLEYSDEQFEALEYDLRMTISAREFVDKCIDIGLFVSDGSNFWSEAFVRRLIESAEKAAKRTEKAKNAAQTRWKKDAEPTAQEQPQVDDDWLRFVQAYESNIGILPHGGSKTGQILADYFDELGTEVMCKAVEVTNLKRSTNPERFLLAVLRNWADKGVKTVQQADAVSLEHDRKFGGDSKDKSNRPTELIGKFY